MRAKTSAHNGAWAEAQIGMAENRECPSSAETAIREGSAGYLSSGEFPVTRCED